MRLPDDAPAASAGTKLVPEILVPKLVGIRWLDWGQY